MDLSVQWMSILVSPLAGLAGVLGGVWLGAHLQGKKDEQRWQRELTREDERWRRDERRHWIDEQYRMYTDLVGSGRAAIDAMMPALSLHPAFASRRHLDGNEEELSAAAIEAVQPYMSAARACSVLGTTEVLDAAHALEDSLRFATYACRRTASGPSAEEGHMWVNRCYSEYTKLRALVRADLGLPDVEGETEVDG